MTAVSKTEADVVIVGAGLAGLSTAVNLRKSGLSVLVLEAMDRVGGKTLSADASPLGGKVDLGAAWINDTNQSEMYKLAQQFGFDLIEQRVTGMDLYETAAGNIEAVPYGSDTLSEAGHKCIARLMELIERADHQSPDQGPDAAMLDSMTFAEFAEKHFPGEEVQKYADELTKALLGVNADETSALYMIDYMQSGTGIANMIAETKDGGQYLRNRQVRLAELLPAGSVQLSSPVTSIKQLLGGGCIVGTYSGLAYRAKRVVVSVPTSLYPNISFNPPLPAAKQALGESTALGYYSKVILVFDKPWWRDAGMSGVIHPVKGPISFTRDTCSIDDGQYSLTCFILGNSGREWSKWSALERRRQVVDQFDRFFGAVAREKGIEVPEPVNIIEVEWTKEPWARGAPSPVMMPGTMMAQSGKAIRSSVGCVHFVGTETALVWKGYMEGAIRSGARGAQEVIDSLKLVKL
ncbi:hypothetical protein EsH8_VII_000073 [Colletotrichum jinshuiense]